MRPSVPTARGPALLAMLLCVALAGTTMLVAATFDGQEDNRAQAPTIETPRRPKEPSAVGLTREWAAYGGAATCADWSGADGMQAVALGGGKIAWFFADTYLGPIDRADPNAQFSKPLVNNSLVIESTVDGRPRRTTVTGGGACPWDRLPGGEAQALVRPERRGQWYWGGDGILVGDRVLKFYNRYRGGGPRYLPLGNALVSLPAAELTKPRPPTVMDPTIKELPRFVPVRGGSPIMWGSAVYESPSGEADAAAARERRDDQRGRDDKSDKSDKSDAEDGGPKEDGEGGGKPGDGEGDEAGGTAPPTPPGGSATPSPGGAGGAVAATRPVAATAAGARRGAELFIYGWHVRDLNDQRKQMYLARVPKQRVTDFSAWRFYAGAGLWTRNQSGARPVQPPGQDFPVSTASSVVKINGRYWLIQHEPDLDDPDIVAYPALTPWGPFDPAQRMVLYQARAVGRVPANAFRIIYEARAMTALSTAKTLVIGYNLNTTAISTGCRSLSHHTDAIYRPQFLTVPMGDFPRAGPTRTRPRVRSGDGGNPPGTDIVARDPGQWFDAWRFSISACPPMPRIPAVQAVPAPGGTVALSWTGAGLDVAYRVYHREVGGKFYAARTLGATSVTLKGYQPGRTYEWRVVPVNVKGHEGPPTTVTARTP